MMDNIRSCHTCEDGYFPRSFTKSVYENTEPGSVLRGYDVDSSSYKSVPWDKEVHHSLIKKRLDCGNTDFDYDINVASDDVEDLSDNMDPNREMDCGYHHHREGKKCNVRAASSFLECGYHHLHYDNMCTQRH